MNRIYKTISGASMNHKVNYRKLCKILFLFICAFFTGHFAARAVDYFQPEAIETSAEGSWGLSFQEDGEPPVANATAEELRKNDAYYAEETDEKVLYVAISRTRF